MSLSFFIYDKNRTAPRPISKAGSASSESGVGMVSVGFYYSLVAQTGGISECD